MRFWKGEALGNDYVVLDATEHGPPVPSRIRAICGRHTGVGADGVLVADLSTDPPGLRIFNPDGGEAEKSGNGLRIFGAWLLHRGLVSDEHFAVALPRETVTMSVIGQPPGRPVLRVDMGVPSFRAGDIPYAGAAPDAEVEGASVAVAGTPLGIHLVSLGNPHCVVFFDTLDDDVFRRLAPALQSNPDFTFGINVQFARVVDSTTLEARIWERGAGETLASGSSACAVVAAAHRSARVEAETVTVRMPGGTVVVGRGEGGRLALTGEAAIVYEGEIPPAILDGWDRA